MWQVPALGFSDPGKSGCSLGFPGVGALGDPRIAATVHVCGQLLAVESMPGQGVEVLLHGQGQRREAGQAFAQGLAVDLGALPVGEEAASQHPAAERAPPPAQAFAACKPRRCTQRCMAPP